MSVVYATRRSKLALAQSRAFVASLQSKLPEVDFEELTVVTEGDRIQDRPLYEVGGKGLFVKEIEEALLERRADFAVHSIKDVPAELPPGLRLSCIPKRESPCDVLLAREGLSPDLAKLPEGAMIGTSSLRRSLALSRQRPDLRIVPLRGNVDTRMSKLRDGALDAIVLAEAGLVRLGLDALSLGARLPVSVCVPAVGQGALGIEARADDDLIRERLALVHDAPTARAVSLERGVLRALGADCKTPLAAYAEPSAGGFLVRAWRAEPDGSAYRSFERELPDPGDEQEADRVGRALALEFLLDPSA